MCVTKLVVDKVEEAELAEAAAGYRIKNKNPTQRCGGKNNHSCSGHGEAMGRNIDTGGPGGCGAC